MSAWSHRSVSIGIVVLAFGTSAGAQPRGQPVKDLQLDAATRTRVIERSLVVLAKLYVFPDVAAKLGVEIRKQSKKYDSITSSIALAQTLTADFQAITHDKHMRVMFDPDVVPDRKPDDKPSPAEVERFHDQMRFFNAGYVKAERLDGNVGYLRLDGFLPVEAAAPRAAAAMTLLADTGALIIDLRFNGGGDPASVALLVSYLYAADDSHHINDIYWRPDNSTRQYWTSFDLAGARYPLKPVYVLTSKDTFSGAEEFAYDVQTLKRASIVGEVTGGGANPGGPEKVDAHFMVNVPQGRAINPVTKTNWEGVGVKPEVVVTAEQALDTAYLKALQDVKKTIDAKKRPGMAREIDDAIAKLSAARKK